MKQTSKPSLKPQKISETAWYYEYPGHIEVVVEWRDKAGHCIAKTPTVKIPWRKLIASLKRCQPSQRWIWTPDGMERYRPHPLMPDVGGVFVSAEDHVSDNSPTYREIADAANENGARLLADRDRWRTWAGETRLALRKAMRTGLISEPTLSFLNATLATYPTEA